MWLTDSSARCVTPAGIGAGINAAIEVETSANTLFSYAPPSVTALQGAPFNTDGTSILTVRGTMFGETASTVTVSVGGSACSSPSWVSPTQLECTGPSGVGKSVGVVVQVGGRQHAVQLQAPG